MTACYCPGCAFALRLLSRIVRRISAVALSKLRDRHHAIRTVPELSVRPPRSRLASSSSSLFHRCSAPCILSAVSGVGPEAIAFAPQTLLARARGGPSRTCARRARRAPKFAVNHVQAGQRGPYDAHWLLLHLNCLALLLWLRCWQALSAMLAHSSMMSWLAGMIT